MKKGFSLLELVIVLVVVGTLATLALPQYTRSRERALGREAQSNLRLILAAEKIYQMEYITYWPASGSNSILIDINNNLKLSLVPTNWSWSVTGGAATFTASADRVTGPYSNCIYQITQAGGNPTSTNCP